MNAVNDDSQHPPVFFTPAPGHFVPPKLDVGDAMLSYALEYI